MRVPFFLAIVLTTANAGAQLTQVERKGLRDTLYMGNLSESDLDWERRMPVDRTRLPFIDLCLNKPLEAADTLMTLHSRGEGTPSDVLRVACETVFGDRFGEPKALDGTIVFPAPVPEALRRPLSTLLQAIGDANSSIRSATRNLTPEERRGIIESLPQWAIDSPSVTFDFVKQPRLPRSQMLALLQRVDLPAIREAAWRLSDTIQTELPKWRALAKSTHLEGTLKFKAGGVNVELGGQGDDVHDSRDAGLCIDLGGNNTYTGRYGAGVDYASVLIDCGSGSRFGGPDVNVGAGVLGIGLAYVLGGNDTFTGKSICYGAGLAGVGLLYKESGNDVYRCKALGEGFGMFGVGLLLDSGGNDFYSVGAYGQGAGRTQGLGWLIDQAGNDTYRAGGILPAGSIYPEKYAANAQGYGGGYSADDGVLSGGVGLLTDLSGDDIYSADVRAQASANWYGVGSLYDGAGTDSYTATSEAQAYGGHSGAAYLFDLAGDDTYTVRQGSCHAFGHDWGVALLLDREGNDVYAARDSRPGTGSANGLGIFIDADGGNRFIGPPASGVSARGTGSLGVFCALGGPNLYAEGLDDGQARVDENWAVAYSVGRPSAGPETPIAAVEMPRPDSLPFPPLNDLEAIYAHAIGDGRDAREALNHLIAIGLPAFEWLLKEKLPSAEGRAVRVISTLGTALGREATPAVAKLCESPDMVTARSGLSLAEELGSKVPSAVVITALKRQGTEKEAAALAGSLGLSEAIPDLLPLTISEDRILARTALLALVKVGNESVVSSAQALLGSSDIHLRKAAIQLIGRFPSALAVASGLLTDPDEKKQRIAIEILAAAGTPEALKIVIPYLTGGTAGTKIQALLALNGRVPEEARSKVLDLRKDPNSMVRAVASRIDLGR